MATAVQILPQTRSQIYSFLQADLLSSTFHELFATEANTKKRFPEKKKVKKKVKTKTKEKKTKRDKSPEPFEIQLPNIELSGNPSAFTVFANVRYAVLEHCIKEAAWMFHQANNAQTSDSEEEENDDKNKDGQPLKIPRIVGMGLNLLFEIVRETQMQYPKLCVKALQALLDLLQGQLPEGMKGEPDVMEGMFQLLMELTTGQGLENISLELSNKLTSLACAGLISLVIAWGDTGKYLTAIGAMLMNTNPLCGQMIPVSSILTSLQKSIHAVLHGRTQLPDWLSQGVKVKALADSFKLDSVSRHKVSAQSHCALASDGCYLYVLNKQGLSKVGSGFGGTIKGHVYTCKDNFDSGKGWLAYAGAYLLFHPCNENKSLLYIINQDSLEIEGTTQLQDISPDSSVLFSDGQNIGQIASTKDDSFVVRTYDPYHSPMSLISEVPLKLARKCMDVFGLSGFDPAIHRHSINTGFDEDAVTISAGREFTLIRTVSGKVLYCGKSQALGIKQGGPTAGKWAELPITKSPKIVQVVTGHDSQHALLVSDDGSVFFVGTPRRGEDGDSSIVKVRRQPKAMKPKKLIRLESKNVVFVACNNGSSAMVTKEGEVFMFGKDTAHCDHASGHVTDLKDVIITQISLGKAHAVTLTNKGLVYTFGINNKGQCGREYSPGATKEENVILQPDKKENLKLGSSNVTMAEEEDEGEPEEIVCPQGKHRWRHDQCMVCTVCGECTGYGVNCISSGRFDRSPGLPCGCGAGESGCAECGVCRSCAGESEITDQLNERVGRPGVKPLEQIGKRMEHKIEKVQKTKNKSLKQNKFRGEVDEQETDYAKMVSLPPAEIMVGDGDIPVTQVSCGQHHTVVLLQNGDVYTFGSNQYGQLGVGDTVVRGIPTKLQLPMSAVQVAAGSSHTVILLANGQVYTCGSYQKGALGRICPEEGGAKEKSHPWFTLPGPVPGIGARYGRRATWIGASSDQTFMRIDESLINAHTLTGCNIFANQSCIGLIPAEEDSGCSMKCLMISKHDGSCKSFISSDQENLFHHAVCLDPVYDTLWSYNPSTHTVNCYMVLLPEVRLLQTVDTSYCNILSPEMFVPTRANSQSTRSHCSLHMLACLDTLTTAQQLHLTVYEEAKEKLAATKDYTKEDFSVTNRFDSHGGGWGYSGHSVEAIRFMSDTDILLGGFGLFGGRGEYYGRIKLFELGFDGADNEQDGSLLAETEEVPFECAARETYAMLFYEPVSIQANIWYVAWARISGPSSDCGSSGQAVVTTEDQVVFKFKSSKKSNNGTDVNAGQIPQLLYRLPSPDRQTVPRKSEYMEPAHVLTQDFSRTVSPDCFDALLSLLEWAWSSFHASAVEVDSLKGISRTAVVLDLQRFVYICKACLRLLKIYINEVYSDGAAGRKNVPENMKLAECVGNSRDLLRKILAEEVRPSKVRIFLPTPPTSPEFQQMEEEILSACHDTFTGCFHAFYPTANLKWLCLCDLLVMLEPGMTNMDGYGRLLAAIMEALTHPTIKLTNIMPINCEPETEEILRRQSISIDDNTNSVARLAESHRFPLLVDHMTYRTELEGIGSGHTSFKEVLDRLLMISTVPVRQALNKESPSYPHVLVSNTCTLLLCLISELAASATGSELDLTSTSRPLLVTPNRFTRTIHGAYWNTGNGSPDAVAFTVDRPGILIAGVCVYGGSVVGGQYEYELELLDDQSEGHSDPTQSHTSRWNSLEIVKGSYGPDDCVNDIAEIKFDRPVPIKEGMKYAVLLRNHGPRTLNGDGGLSRVKCPDGTTFTFTSCSLSSNGTNHMRGQLPQIIYYSASQDGEFQQQQSKVLAEMQARKDAIGITNAICRSAIDILHRARGIAPEEAKEILGQSPMFSSLLPLVLAYIGPVATQDPRGAVQVLGLIHEVLPAVVAINNQVLITYNRGHSDTGSQDSEFGGINQHYRIVESDHPYKPATVANYKVQFTDSVKWMVLEFDSQCGTAQNEDTLQLYIPCRFKENALCPLTGQEEEEEQQPTSVLWPVLKKFHGTNWPKSAVVLPGNEVTFSLESASDYVKDEKACFYGFKCIVTGYEWTSRPEETTLHLERELSYLGGMCASALMKKDLTLPVGAEDVEEDLDSVEEGAQLVFNAHSSLLDKGFALSHPPTIMQALEGNLPFCWQSNERAFLKDFVACTPGTSGGRLARWLQPDSYIDPRQCEVIYNKEELKCSWPAILTVLTKDQYGQVVHVPNLKVEVKAIPIDQKESVGEDYKKMRRLSKHEEGDMTFGGHAPPPLDILYEVTVKDRKDVFHSICMMKAYENYSFEELRYAAPAVPRPSENMLVRSNNDGSYNCNWTPGSVGFYNIYVIIDSFDTGETFKVEVKEPPQGVTPPLQAAKKSHQPNKMRRFVGKNSAGLRIRINPSLQSEQIGTIKPDGTISFTDEIHNDDGVWVRLSTDSIKEWCTNGFTEAWCLQYNQHLGKTLLVPIEEPKSILDEIIKETLLRKLPEFVQDSRTRKVGGPGCYQVIKCGSSGHNIRCRPSKKATPVGMLVLGSQLTATEDTTNHDGTWVKLDAESISHYCDLTEGEAWSLARDREDIVYLEHEANMGFNDGFGRRNPFSFNTFPTNSTKGFDFSMAHYNTLPMFGQKSDGFGRSSSWPARMFSFGPANSCNDASVFGQSSQPTPERSSSFGPSWYSRSPNQSNGPLGSTHGGSLGSETRHSGNPFMIYNDLTYPRKSPSGKGGPSKSVKPCETINGSMPTPGTQKSTKKEGMDIASEIQGFSVKELVKALEHFDRVDIRSSSDDPLDPSDLPSYVGGQGSNKLHMLVKVRRIEGIRQNILKDPLDPSDLPSYVGGQGSNKLHMLVKVRRIEGIRQNILKETLKGRSSTQTQPGPRQVPIPDSTEEARRVPVPLHGHVKNLSGGKIRTERDAQKGRGEKPAEKTATGNKSSSSMLGACGISPHKLASIVGCESRFNGNGPTPVPSPPGTPKKTPSRGSSPSQSTGSSRHGSPVRIANKADGTKKEIKEMTVVTKDESPPPPVPVSAFAQRALRGNLPREPSMERDTSDGSISENSRQVSPARSSRGHSSSPRSSPVQQQQCNQQQSQQQQQCQQQQQQKAGNSSLGVSPSTSGSASPQPGGMPVAIATGTAPIATGTAPGTEGVVTSTENSIKAAFNIGTASPKDETIRLSPKPIRKDRGRQLRNKRERAASPSPRDTTPIGRRGSGSTSTVLERPREAVKEALSPSVAECLRAVYAAFLWHEGIVHDAMACASFLKFHPNLSKEMSQVDDRKVEKIRVRHPTDATKESKKDGSNCRLKGDNLNETRVRFFIEHQDSKDSEPDNSKAEGSSALVPTKLEISKNDVSKLDQSKLKPILGRHKSEGSVNYQEDPLLMHSEVTPCEKEEPKLPATLYHLVGFWEELAVSVLNVISKDIIFPSPALSLKSKKAEKKEKEKSKEKRPKKKRDLKPMGRGNLFGESAGVLFAGAAGTERETMCELCGAMYPHPVTYHMRRTHPGCGRHAGGKGYNSGGNFCGGWAGNCGEGGVGGSSWYLICDRCREKYLRERKQTQKEKERSKKYKKKIQSSKNHSHLLPMESHLILKNNAMFLLDLASAAGLNIPSHSRKRTPSGVSRFDVFLPSVSEDISTDLNPFPTAPFQYLIQQGAQASDSAFAEDIFIDTEERVFVRSGSLSLAQKQQRYRPRLPTEPRHSPLARSGSLGQELRPPSHISPPSPQDPLRHAHDTKPLPKSAGTSPEAEQDQKTSIFQRSISEIDGCMLDQGDTHFNRVVMRRRNNSGGVSDGGMSLLKKPSAAMSRLISLVDKSNAECDNSLCEKTLSRPVMAFVIQRHDLDNLQVAMRHALRKAVCRVFAMQGLNWLVRTVTQPTCIHDLLWFFVSSLSPTYEEEEEEEEENEQQVKEKKEKRDQEDVPLCDHPLADVAIAGAAVHPLPITFHTLLQTVADVMMHLPVGTSLQQMAVRCYCLRFTQADHQFLHESHVFSNISRILVKSDDEEIEDANAENSQSTSQLSLWKDLTYSTDIKASSRQTMIASLTDGSTETFWESGDEDRNKTKMINVTCSMQCNPRLIAVHIDNTRDLGNKVSHLQFFSGPAPEEINKIRQVEIEARHVGWVNCYLPELNCRHMKLELKGPDNSLRLRQVKVLGELEGKECRIRNTRSTLKMQQDNCEAETLKVFRLLTSQVFGRLITDDSADERLEEKKADDVDGGESGTARDNDLKEHMLGILFSRGSKLSHLQKQVCSHIVQAIKKETRRVRDEWEASLLSKNPNISSDETRSSDVYCFELLSMVLALSGSSVGRNYLAQQTGLLQDLFSLLHTASPRVQRQVTSVIRRVLPDVQPQALADLLLVPSLPPTDFSILHSTNREPVEEEFNSEKPCILDVFLACISKALTVQTKIKSNQSQKGITTVTLSDCLAELNSSRATGSRWWLRGRMTMCQAGNIIALLQDMAKGHLSEAWAAVSKAAIAEALLALTKLEESLRLPQACMKTPTLWLGLASLCVLDQEHVERLSSGEWRSSPDNQRGPPRPTCDNHDDGETPAIILCNMCGNLCADCNRFLHLHRRTRAHQRQVFKEEEEAIKVDLHEGCGRMKLFWLMLLADSKSLKAMVEFREGKVGAPPAGSGTCRFCGTSSNTGLLAIGNVCSDAECQEHGRNACTKILPCGHTCGGIKNEESCLPCLHRCPAPNQQMLKQDADDMCMICFTEALSAAPAIQLKCAHVFHLHCTKNVLSRKWIGPRITFGFSLCPICKQLMEFTSTESDLRDTINHPVLHDLLNPIRELYEDVRRKALMRLEYEGLHKAEAITTVGARFYNDPAGFAMERYAYYVCYKCNKAYYGGEARCDDQVGAVDDYDPTELVCGACSDVSRAQLCPKHGTDFLEYKCRYCCSVAVFFCFGTTHFCNTCHDDFQRVTNIPKADLPRCPAGPKAQAMEGEECPLNVQHPPTGEEFALGCGVCRNAHTF